MGVLENKVVIITGASSGIGESTAERFVAEGAKVVLAARSVENGEAVSERLGANAVFMKTDVTSTSDIEALIDHTVSLWGKVDCLFNNAGEAVPAFTLEDMTEEAIDSQFALLVKSIMWSTKAVMPHLKASQGCIINNASISAHGGHFAPIIYSAAKAAVTNFTKSSALELAKYKVRVNSISPGPIYTSIFHRAFGISDEVGLPLAGEVRKALGNEIPAGRVGEVEDVAGVALFLASDDSRYVTGQDILVDGGLFAGWSTERMFDYYGGAMDVLGVPRPPLP
jgi:NAD(P)-dependent dehydrogenase (short-subunit alcohol dehydrogenase family)